MLSLIMTIVVLIIFFKITGFIFRIAGKFLGLILGIIGWIFLGGIIVTVLGMAISVLPVFLVIGGIAVIAALAK